MRKLCMFFAAMCFVAAGLCAGPAFSADKRVISPQPGIVNFEAGADELLELRVNITPRSGDVPAHEWFLFTASTLTDIYLLCPQGIFPLTAPDLDFFALTYSFSRSSDTDAIATLTMKDLGLNPGDVLYYAYAYTPSDIEHVVLENIVILQVTAAEGGLSRFSSDTELETWLKKGIRRLAEDRYYYYDGGGIFTGSSPSPDSASAPAESTSSSSNSNAGSQFSTTNLQESGVDEADVMKTDGKYLYAVPRYYQDMYYWTATDSTDSAAEPEAFIRVMRINETPPSAAEAGKIMLGEHKNPVDGLYLVTGRGENKPDILATIGGTMGNMWGCWFMPWYWTQGNTEVVLYNVSTPENASRITKLELDGHLISSRRIGDTLYLVTRFTPMPEGYDRYVYTDEEMQKNEQILNNADLPDLLPGLRVNGEDKGSLVSAANCFIPPFDETRTEQPTLITITAIRLDSPETPVSQSISGPTETIYVSQETLYLATVRHDYSMYYSSFDTGVSGEYPENTDLHKFALTDAGPVYKASGTVPGHLGWEQDKKPFRMSEYENVLRIATSLGNTWTESSTTRLTLMKEDGQSGLKEVSHLGGIGKPGEQLYAVRFAGKNAYIVTFRATDPLYVFDLSDPANPKTLGELQIDGYSDYLHPVGENLLLGIGKDAIPDTSSSDFGGRGAWYQGLKLSLFDISNPASPKEVNSLVIGKRGTGSEALYDHHAFTWLPASAGRPARLAVPVEMYSTVGYYTSDYNPSKPWYYYNWTHTGLYMFNVFTGEQAGGKTGIEDQGRMIVADNSGIDPLFQSGYYAGSGTYSDRSVILGNSVHYVHDGKIWSASWGSGADMTQPQ